MRIYLIRHGETIFNANRTVQFGDTPLSERGLEQARQLGEYMRDEPITAILSSDYERAHRTAKAVQRTTGAPLHIRTSLRERHFGDHRGTPFAELTFDLFAADYHPPNGESWQQFYERVERAWTQVRDYAVYNATGDFAVVCHALVCRALVDRCVTVPRALIPADGIRFGNTAVTVIDSDTNTVSVLGSTAHLSAEHITYPNHPKGL
ncbi:MAG: broad specificity phosphatase PhoE [Gammaproteobacteria bacterium]|jgi:broad specificity phosphatase PhoE